MRPQPWQPTPPDIQALQLLIRERDDLVAVQTQTRNRQHALAHLPQVPAEVQAPLDAVRQVLAEHIVVLNRAIRQRATTLASIAHEVAGVQTIAGVGLLTAGLVLVEARPLRAGATAKQVVAYAGLAPAPRESGSSVHGAGHISKTGNARLRQAVYMAAVSAVRCNAVLRACYLRLLARGKRKQVALVAVARKLLVCMVTLLHQQGAPPAAPVAGPPTA